MKKTGKFFSVIFCVLLLAVGYFDALAQSDISVQATVSENTIYTGERMQLSIKISGDFNDISRPKLPEFEGFRLLSNRPSTSRSFQYINGKSSTSYTYSYQLIAQKKGSYTLPGVPVSIDGTEYKTDPIDVSVLDRNEAAESKGGQRPDIFLKLEVSNTRPVTGQQIIADVVLYFQQGLQVSSYQPIPGWKAEGFWKESLTNNERPEASTTILDGLRYRRARLLQFALFPTKSGKLEISPYEINVSVRSSRSRGDSFSSFFGNFGGNRRQITLKSDPITLNVRPLPPTDSSRYLGAVGNFDISREISSRQVVEGESIEIKTHIKGTGNIPLISKPHYKLPEGLEVYEPQETSQLNRNQHRISGSKTFTDVIIARTPGQYTIPEKTLVFYNPDKGRYIFNSLPELQFAVKPNPNAIASASGQGGMPVSPITGLASWTSPHTQNLLSYWWFWAGIILPLCILGLAYWRKSYAARMSTDRGFARSQRAADKANDRLDKAITLSEDGHLKEAYNMLQKALTGFIGDRLNLPEAGLSNKEYIQALRQENIDDELVENIRLLLDKCASISYAPSNSHEYLKSHVGLAQSTLDKLKKVL